MSDDDFIPKVPTVFEGLEKAFTEMDAWDTHDQITEYKFLLRDIVKLAALWEHNALRWADPLIPSPKIAELCEVIEKLGDAKDEPLLSLHTETKP